MRKLLIACLVSAMSAMTPVVTDAVAQSCVNGVCK